MNDRLDNGTLSGLSNCHIDRRLTLIFSKDMTVGYTTAPPHLVSLPKYCRSLKIVLHDICLTADHIRAISGPQSQLNVRKYFSSIRVIDKWNSLPGSVIYSNNVNTFKAKIDCLFRNRGYIHISY